MTTFIQKLRVVTLGTAHDLLDKAIDLNSPSALRQYVRDLEDALAKLTNEAAVQAGQIRTLTREQGDLSTRISTDKTLAAKYLQSNPSLARVKASDAVMAQKELDSINQQLVAQKELSNKLDASVTALDAKHTEMLSNVRRLESMDRQSKAQDQAASALTSAGKTLAGGADVSIDNIEQKIEARNDVAAEKFSRAMGSFASPEDPEHTAAVDELLASLTPTPAA